MLYRFKVSNETNTHSVFVKAPLHASAEGRSTSNVSTKPLLYPKTDTEDRHWLQYTALVAIYDYFTNLDEEQFGAVRALDYLPEYYAVFTEDSSDPNLRQLMLKEIRWHFHRRKSDLALSFQNVGAWLHLYHRMPKKEDVSIRHANRQDYIEAVATLVGYLAQSLGKKSFLDEVAALLIRRAGNVLPESLPLGLGHGDYSMRNILVGPNHRITVLDTFAKWQTPIYEDIGYFINELKMSSPQVMSQGLAYRSSQLTLYEDAFLKGYFSNEPIPYPAIRLYEALAILDKWSSFVGRFDQQTLLNRNMGRPRLSLVNRYFKKQVKDLVANISRSQ